MHIIVLTLFSLSRPRRSDLSSACGATCGEKGGIITRYPFAPCSPLPSLAILCTLEIGRQPPASPPRYEYATTMLTPARALSCRACSRGIFDADRAPPTLQPFAVLGWRGSRSKGHAGVIFLVRVVHAPKASVAQEIGAFAWPCGRRRSRAAAKKHRIVLTYP